LAACLVYAQPNNMYLVRAFTVLLVIIFAESVHGTLRQLFLAPLIGDFMARRISFFIAVLLIFLITYFFIRWISAPNVRSLFVVGLMWMILMTLFEFGLGHFVMNYSWEQMLVDYDVSRGGLMGFGLIFMLFAPWLATKLRRKKSQIYEI
jgi:hypothetical protein